PFPPHSPFFPSAHSLSLLTHPFSTLLTLLPPSLTLLARLTLCSPSLTLFPFH
ncbi:unnamed protein product, partial [Closterium sp. Naga37s-1]